jgi:hypothetical protein
MSAGTMRWATCLLFVGRAALLVTAIQACRSFEAPEPQGAQPPTSVPPGAAAAVSAIPDTVVRGMGLPPRADDSTSRALGPQRDTLVVATAWATPAWSASPSQVGPGMPTSGPMRLEVRVLVRDTSTSVYRPLALAFGRCPVVLRLYRAAERTGAPAWRSDAAGALACPTPWQPDSPFNDRSVSWDVPAVLGDSLPAGRYHFAYDVRLDDGRVLSYATGSAFLTAATEPPARDYAALRYTAVGRVEQAGPRQLVTTVWVRNPTARSLRFEHGGCALQVRLFRSPVRSGAPVWRSEARRPPYPNSAYGCPAYLALATLAPGDSLPFTLAVPLYEVLADSLPAGRYWGTAALTLLDDSRSVTQWEVPTSHDLGAVDLPPGPDRLPAVRVADGVRAEAATRLVPGTGGADTVRTLVMFTNGASTSRQVEVARDCPVMAYAYRSALLRDSVPATEPAWRSPTHCSISPYRFTLAPGQSWVFHHDVPAAALRGALGAGRAWFTAWVVGAPTGMLAAGEVELR